MFKLGWICSLLSVWLFCTTARAAEPALVPAEHYTRSPDIQQVLLSPSGQRLALLTGTPEGRTRLAAMTVDPLGSAHIVAGFNNADIKEVHWVTDDRLVFMAYEPDVAVVREGHAGLFAVDFDGGQLRQLISWSDAAPHPGLTITSRILPYGWFFHSTLQDGSDDILVVHSRKNAVGDVIGISPARLNTRTGALRNLSLGMPEGTQEFWTDEKNEPRVLQTEEGSLDVLYARASDDAPWVRLTEVERLSGEGFTPLLLQPGGSMLVLASHTNGTALYRYDLRHRKLDEAPLVAVAGYDLAPDGDVEWSSHELLGVHFVVDRPMSYWFEESMDRIQRGIDKALPGRSNRLSCSHCKTDRFIVVTSTSDRNPGEFWLFDRKEGKLGRIGASRPWLNTEQQGRRTAHRFKARDGLEIPLYVTHPAGAKDDEPLPTVVLVHGGPWERGSSITWNQDAQFLASRGYRVLEPEFRGSTGYGWNLFRAGWKAWGGAMQDDLIDAIGWAADRKWVDRDRVCIFGASYGGYAALMAPILYPKAFRCAVAFAAVTDPILRYDVSWSDASESVLKYSLPVLMGDRDKDAALLERASPLKRVAELRIPVLLAHGGEDRRVPQVHADKFAAAARAAQVSVDKVVYPDEGHGWFKPSDQTDFYLRVERFLAAALKP